MIAPVTVTHPIPCLHRPPRARTDRLAHLTGTTPVEVRSFEAPPSELARYRDTPIVEAEGRAWMRAREAGTDLFLDPASMRATLEGSESWVPAHGGFATLHDYLVRSPLCRYDGRTAARTGAFAPARAGTVAEGSAERAAATVRDFVDDRIRLHGDAVYLRYERMLFAMPLHVGFLTEFPLFPRQSVGASAHLGTRGYQGMEMNGEGWEAHRAIPMRLLGDEDALWFANVLPQRMLATLSRPGLRPHQDDATWRPFDPDGCREIEGMRNALGPLAHLGETLSITGDALLPALRTVHEATARIAHLSGRAANRSRMLVHADDARAYGHAAETIQRHALPRLEARLVPPTGDVEALSHLTP